MSQYGPLPDPHEPLGREEARQAFADILDAKASEDEIAIFLVALSERGETSLEIAEAAKGLRERLIPIEAPAGAIDVCGTGGDGHHTLNVSTAVALVVAACGVPVAKHGNRAASSKAGAADTLEALGLDMERAGRLAEASLRDIGIAFLFAANHHPAMKRITPIRRRIGRRTIFNLMGPLANPAHVTRQLIGIARPDYAEPYADALEQLRMEHRITPEAVGIASHPISAIRGGEAEHNAAALRRLLLGEKGAYRDAVLMNTAAALQVAGRVSDWQEGIEEASEVLDNGLANTLLDCWIAYK